MPAVPKKRKTKSKIGMRRSHDSLKSVHAVKCGQCKKLIPGHTVCMYCGYYKGKEVVKK